MLKGEAREYVTLPISPAVPETSIPLINILLNPTVVDYVRAPRSLASSYERTGSTRSNAVSRVRRCGAASANVVRYVYGDMRT